MSGPTELRIECRVVVPPTRRPRRRRPRTPRLPPLVRALVLGHQIAAEIASRRFATVHAAAQHIRRSEMWVSQVLALTRLAPDIQAAILTLPDEVVKALHENQIRPLTRLPRWADQRTAWNALLAADEKI